LRANFYKAFRLRGEWEVGVISLAAAANSDALVWIFCDVVDFSYINDSSFQIVDVIDSGGGKKIKKNAKPLYVKVIKKHF